MATSFLCVALRTHATCSTLLDTLSGRLAGSAVMTGLVQVNGHATQLTYGATTPVHEPSRARVTVSLRPD